MVGNMQFNDPNNCEDQPDNNEDIYVKFTQIHMKYTLTLLLKVVHFLHTEEQEVVMEISNGDQEAEGEEEDDTSISEQGIIA